MPECDVLLIVGASRSGSTLLERLLDATPDGVALGEVHNIWTRGMQKNHLCGCGQPFRDCAFWNRVLHESGVPAVEDILRLQRRVVRKRCLPVILLPRIASHSWSKSRDEYLEVLTSLYIGAVRVSGKRAIVDSSKRPIVGLLLRQAPGIRLLPVHLIRDSRATSFSTQKRRSKSDSGAVGEIMLQESPLRAALGWLQQNALAELLICLVAPSVTLKYETLVDDPAGAVREVLDAFDMVRDVSSIGEQSADLGTAHTVSGNPMRMRVGTIQLTPDDEWLTAMSKRAYQQVTAITSLLLLRYGYSLRRTRTRTDEGSRS